MGLFERAGLSIDRMFRSGKKESGVEALNDKENSADIVEGSGAYKEFIARQADPRYLPSHDEITGAFKLENFSSALNQDQAWNSFVAGLGDVKINQKKGKTVVKGSEHYDVLNQEYIAALGSYLAERVREYGATQDNPLTVLEVGAGRGRTSYFLREYAKQHNLPVLIKACDSGSWNIPDNFSEEQDGFSVEKMDYKEGLEKFHPDIVVSCWMPPGVDFTEDFRKNSSIKEYILTGQVDRYGHHEVGDNIKTWGNLDPANIDAVPAFQQDGFEEVVLTEAERFQLIKNMNAKDISRYKSIYDQGNINAIFGFRPVTASFRRKNN